MTTKVVGTGDMKDFWTLLVTQGTRKYVRASVGTSSSATVYTCPTGKKAFIVAICSVREQENWNAVIRIWNSRDNILFDMLWRYSSSTGLLSAQQPLFNFLELQEGDYIKIENNNSNYSFIISFLIYEIDASIL